MRIELRPVTAIALLFVVLIAVSGASAVTATLGGHDHDPGADRSTDSVVLEDGSELWPYTSRGPNYRERTLPINLVVYGDPATTETLLREATVAEWDELDDEQQDIAPAEEFDVAVNETTVAWGSADGAVRYVYVQPPNTDGLWLQESYQLRDGDYLGARQHVRAYQDPVDGDWTAMQAHREHWDWFHLRHTVHSTDGAQSYVEEEFLDAWYVETLTRERFGNDASSDADGWATVVEIDRERLSVVFGLLSLGGLGLAGSTRLRERYLGLLTDEGVRTGGRALAVVGALVGLYAAVRFGAIGLERLVPDANPKLVIALFYPVLVCGMPVVAYLAARQLDGIRAFAAAATGFAIAILVDYTYLGVASLPMDTFVHRAALAVAIGFVAAGASQTARTPGVELGHVRTGVLLWLVAIAVPLLQFV